VVVGVFVLNPIADEAVRIGHPEELLGAVLCVAAVLCAIHDRPIWAGVLLGLAVAHKEWALLAVGPVVVALSRRRLLALTWAAAVAGVIIIPFLIAQAVTLNHGLQGVPGVNAGGGLFTPWQVWWFFGSPAPEAWSGRLPPSWLPGLAHPLIVGVSIPLTLLYVLRLRRRRSAAPDALLLLAFLFLLRCMLDPWDISYYSIPFLIALVAWEALRFRRLPLLALTATLFAWILYLKSADKSLHLTTPHRQAVGFLLVSLSATAAMACGLYAPRVRQRLVRRAARRVSVEPPLEPG
jgi:Glycosyltransferase family 87